MPVSLLPLPEQLPDRYAEAVSTGQASDALALRVIADDAQLTGRAIEAGKRFFSPPTDHPRSRVPLLSADEATERFGVEGRLSFDRPVSEAEAAHLSSDERRRAFRDDVLSRADINPLQAIGGALVGGLTDPLGLPLMFAPELLGVRAGVEGAITARAGEAIVKAGRVGSIARGAAGGLAEGLVGGALYEAPNFGLRRYAGEDDYSLGDSLANVALGGVLGAGFGALAGALGREGAEAAGRLPAAVERLDEDARLGALAKALDDAIDDRPPEVGSLIEAQAARSRPQPEALAALDETRLPSAAEGPLAQRPLEDAVAVTTRGTEIPVRYALVELDDLVTSHTDDLTRNPAFPPELQPRARERAGAQARNYALEAELNPKRLMRETGAESGAPIVAADGVVESGNGRTIALRRSAASDGPAWQRYRAELQAQGLDTTGMNKPVLVRVRTQAMSGEGRAALTREMNADVTERMSAAEQAMADAAALDPAVLSHLDGTPAGERAFARAFLGKVAPDQQNLLIATDGTLAQAGAQRVKAALVAHAYGDARLVEALFEAADPNIRTIGAALGEAAPDWARMRAAAAAGEIPAEIDLTGALRSAVDLVRHARDAKRPVAELIAERLDQVELFGGGASVSPETEAFLRLFFRDGSFRQQRASASIAAALGDYARQAQAVTPGPNLFGETADAGTAREILDALARKYAGGEAEPAGGDLLAAVDPGGRPDPVDLRPDGGGGAGGEGGSAGPGQADGVGEATSPHPTPSAPPSPQGGGKVAGEAFIAADPELKALADDTEAFAAAHGVELGAAEGTTDPNLIAEAIRAAAMCLGEGGE